MNNVITRSLVLLAVSTAVVLVSAFAITPADPTPTPAGTNQEGMAGHGMSGMATTVDSEEAFITGMIPHHQEAVASARAVLETTQRSEIRELAQDVIATQTEEIATLEGWLERWYSEATEAEYAPMMENAAGLSSDEADRTFLEGMIEHHQGAIDMATSYLDAGFEKQSEVIDLAETIVSVQDGEIEQMQGWLNDWYGAADNDREMN